MNGEFQNEHGEPLEMLKHGFAVHTERQQSQLLAFEMDVSHWETGAATACAGRDTKRGGSQNCADEGFAAQFSYRSSILDAKRGAMVKWLVRRV